MLIKSVKTKLKGIHAHVLPDLPHGAPGVGAAGVNDERRRLMQALRQIDDLRKELMTQREARFQEGFEAGKKMAYEQTLTEMKQQVKNLAITVDGVREKQVHLIERVREFTVDFALQIVEKIIGSEAIANVKVDRQRLLDIVNDVADRFADSAKFVFRLHPEVAASIEEHREEIQANLPASVAFTVIEDPSLKKCDCLVESDFGILDARLETQLQQIRHAVHERGEPA